MQVKTLQLKLNHRVDQVFSNLCCACAVREGNIVQVKTLKSICVPLKQLVFRWWSSVAAAWKPLKTGPSQIQQEWRSAVSQNCTHCNYLHSSTVCMSGGKIAEYSIRFSCHSFWAASHENHSPHVLSFLQADSFRCPSYCEIDCQKMSSYFLILTALNRQSVRSNFPQIRNTIFHSTFKGLGSQTCPVNWQNKQSRWTKVA